ncbi:hypothetical protein GCM10027275_10320 [Rhabdobacter roseus]|uniref:Peptidase S74 domain-containing protein n=1 Tax=Rhabdobacter roseus TaxID=1655419 RepID=A0A840TSG3_9BACT|nr:hypothetical protein [Rhabdobacter roseus]MBB5282940.1 hypothetical protein [Rhabdobacter roseus]
MKHPFTLPVLLALLATSAVQAQNKIITPAQQPLVVGNAGLRHAALNASSPTAPWNGKVLSLDANGLMILVKDSAGGSGSTLWNVSGSHINYLPGNVGIGTATPLQRLHVNGDINLSSGSGLRTNNMPFLSVPGTNNTVLGVAAGSVVSTGIQNVYVGTSAGRTNTSGSSNAMIGFEAGRYATGTDNTYIGTQAGVGTISTANSSSHNVMIGSRAGASTVSGGYNTILGFQAGQANTSGNGNSFLGSNAGVNNTSGAGNTFLGANAGLGNTSGIRNVFMGNGSGITNTTGSENTALGNGANFAANNLARATVIGAFATVACSNCLVLGDPTIKVGIGLTTPLDKLHLNGGTIRLNLNEVPIANGTLYNVYLNAAGQIVRSASSSARQGTLETPEFSWQLNDQNLYNTNLGGVLVGGGLTTIPAGYKLYVSEGILTERVKVALKSTDEWRDHVFQDDYKLRPLAETEAFIKEHRHLPGVPSAEAMVQQGNDLHRTDALLLEKIEELTLYLLELNKKNEQQAQKLDKLTKQNDDLVLQVERLQQQLSPKK